MNYKVLFPGTGIFHSRSLWLLIATSFAIVPLVDLSRPLSAACGAFAIIAVGIAFRRLILFPALAALILLTAWFSDMDFLYRWIHELLRGVFS
jgi:hypothetical protein